MVNIWEFANTRPKIKIRTKSNDVYTGYTLMVWDADESDDDEDSITIEMSSGEIKSFYPSDIVSIETIE